MDITWSSLVSLRDRAFLVAFFRYLCYDDYATKL